MTKSYKEWEDSATDGELERPDPQWNRCRLCRAPLPLLRQGERTLELSYEWFKGFHVCPACWAGRR